MLDPNRVVLANHIKNWGGRGGGSADWKYVGAQLVGIIQADSPYS